MLLEIIKAIIFGIIEGVTEWLPISSTGHMIILNNFLKLDVSKNFYTMFEVVIQLGAIMAVVILFWNKLWPFSKKEKYFIKKDTFMMWFKILAACIPAGIIGILFDEKFEQLFYKPIPVALALIIVGIIFILVETMFKKKPVINTIKDITFKTAFIIGIFQLTAGVFPGVSRSGATIIGSLLIGLSRSTAAEFSFFLAIPTMFGASLLKLVKFGFHFSASEIIILIVGMITAFVVSLIVIKMFMNYIKKKDFKIFGYYRIALGITVLLYFLLR